MKVEESYPAPIHGVSTLAPRNRGRGKAGKQVNFRSDPVNKLARRPSMKWISPLLLGNNGANLINHSYEREGVEYRFLIDTVLEQIYVFIDKVLVNTFATPSNYVGGNMRIQTVNHTTYFVNPDKIVTMLPDTDASIVQKVAHVNVMSALNYGETVQINVTKSDGTRHSVSYTVPDLGITNPNYDRADKARATKQVAVELAARLNSGPTTITPNPSYPTTPYTDATWIQYCAKYIDDGSGFGTGILNPDYDISQSVCNAYVTSYAGIPGVTAVALGSSVAIWETDKLNWLDVEVEAGQGNRSCVAVNSTIESTDGLPLYAVVGTRITVKPNPVSAKGTYYLQAERTADAASGEDLEEVVWAETRNPTQKHTLDSLTMPFTCTLKDSVFTLNTIQFRSRKTGDDDSVKQPEFVGQRITNLGYFQKRLMFLSENSAIMSETDDEINFWKQSAVQLLVNDPVAISSSATEIDRLQHAVPHNRDMLLIASNGQFKISGSEGVTPQTVSMALTTKYESQVDVAPVTMGNSVFFPIDYGESTGLQEYTGEKDTGQDFAEPLTHQVIGYMPGKAKLLAASPNLEMIAVTTSEAADNQLFMYEQYTNTKGEKAQRSWSEWLISGNSKILDLEFRNDRLTILVVENNNVVLKEIDMYARVSTTTKEVHLDDLLKVQTDGLTATLPDDYDAEGIVVIRGDGTLYELHKIDHTIQGSTITFVEDIQAGYVYIGKQFSSNYVPTRPFKYDEHGIAATTDKIRISKFVLSIVDTNEVKMKILSDYYNTDDQVFNSRYVGALNNKVGELPFHTGDVQFSFAQDANLAEAEFYCDNWLGCTIAGISWKGQYHKSTGGM